MKRHVVASALAATTLALPALAAVEGYTLVDNFESGLLDGGLWADQERIRAISGSTARLLQRDVGSRTDNSGGTYFTWNTPMTRPTPATQLRAVVRVNAIDVVGCTANTAYTTQARARLTGSFFNTGARTLGSFYGDVLAQVSVSRASNSTDGTGVLRVRGNAFVCSDADCNVSASIGSTVDLGTVSVGQDVTLAVEWDRALKTFTFIRDNGAASGSLTYTVSDSNEPGNDRKAFGTRTDMADCAANESSAAIDATFDTFSVNSKAKP